MAKGFFSKLNNLSDKSGAFMERYFAGVLLLLMRLWIADVFFKSGLTKISNFDATISLFEYEYAVPLLPPVLAAILATIFELTCSVLLVVGLMTRFATLPLIGMTLVIQFSVIQNTEHFYWLFLLSTIFIYGAGKLSADALIKKF